MRLRWLVVVALVVAPGLTGWLEGQQERSDATTLAIADYLDWESVADPQVSPDGQWVTFIRRSVNKLTDRWESAIWLMRADGSEPRSLGRGSNVQWSPDGTRIAYVASAEGQGAQIFVRWMRGEAAGAVIQVSRVEQPPQHVRWSPDGKRLSFTMDVPAPREWRVDLPAAPRGAQWAPPPIKVDRLHYRTDGIGYLPDAFTHLFVVPAEGGTSRQLTTGEWHVGARPYGVLFWAMAPAWTPDGRTIVIEGMRTPDWEYRYREVQLYAVDVQTGALRTLVDRKGIWSNPAVSPDGRSIAFTGYEWTLDAYHAYDLWIVGIDGTGMRNLTRGLDRNVENPIWASDGKGVYFTAGDRGSINVYHASVTGGVRPVTQGAQVLTLNSRSNMGVAVGVRSTPAEPTDVVRFDLNAATNVRRLTSVNDDVIPGRRLGAVEEIWATSTGGARVQGWVVKPPDFDRGRKYPLILEIHGGPNEMFDVGFDFGMQQWAASGYVVLMVNPRGSTGYGTAFGNAIDAASPGVDYDDLMAAVDTVIGRGYVDPENLFVTGCSYGGIMSTWIIGHTDRFAAAAPRCIISNRISLTGTSDAAVYQYSLIFREKYFWQDPELWLRLSPIMYVGRVKTPTLLMGGEDDLRTPITQAEEFYQALKMRKVPVVLLRFQSEAHGTGSRPSNYMRTQLYILDWFKQHRRPSQASGPR